MKTTNPKIIHLSNKIATKKFAQSIAEKVASSTKKSKHGTVIGLVGELGAGKTSFTQSFLKALGARGRITSPTFVLVKPYALSANSHHTAYHIDTYRIDSDKELLALGLKDMFSEPHNIVIIEWADKFKKLLPKNTIWIELAHGAKDGVRSAKVKGI